MSRTEKLDPPHVLVIEDDVPILTLFGRSLELAGLRVTSRETSGTVRNRLAPPAD